MCICLGFRKARKEDEGDLNCSIWLIAEDSSMKKKEWLRFCLPINRWGRASEAFEKDGALVRI